MLLRSASAVCQSLASNPRFAAVPFATVFLVFATVAPAIILLDEHVSLSRAVLVGDLMTLGSIVLGASLTVLVAGPAGAQSTPTLSADFFETKIRPVLSTKCYACHSSRLAAPKGELVLDTKAGVLKGGKLGPVIVPGNPAESRLL